MKAWLRRIVYFLIILVWLLVMLFPITAVFLSSRGQINIGQNPQRHVRIFMVQEDDGDGIGLEWARKARQQPNCTRTTVRYILWDGDADPSTFTQCFDPITGNPLPATQE